MVIQSSNSDNIVEILSWLPAESLLRFETVSKGWHNIISDSFFQRVQCQRAKPILSGFFFLSLSDSSKHPKYFSLSSSCSIAHPKVLDFLPAEAILAASSNGLLCCYTEHFFHHNQVKHIFVCNPVTKKFVTINWPKGSIWSPYFGLAFHPFCTHVNDLPNFKLVFLSKEGLSEYYLFQVYSSKTAEWRTLKRCEWHSMPDGRVVFASGVLYWVIRETGTLAFDVEMEQSYIMSYPVPWQYRIHQGIYENCIGDSEGRLYYILISEVGIGLWVLSSEFKWKLKHFMYLSAMEVEFPHFLYNEAKQAVGFVPSDLIMARWIVPLFFKYGRLLLKLRCSFSKRDDKIETCTKIYRYNLAQRY